MLYDENIVTLNEKIVSESQVAAFFNCQANRFTFCYIHDPA